MTPNSWVACDPYYHVSFLCAVHVHWNTVLYIWRKAAIINAENIMFHVQNVVARATRCPGFNCLVPLKVESVLINWATVSFWRKALLREVISL